MAYEEVGLNRFTVTGRYTPEFIIFPVYGRKGLMWQDIEGRKKRHTEEFFCHHLWSRI